MDIKDAIEKRDEYIKKHPHLQEFQDQIDDALDKCAEGDRAEVLMILLAGKMSELRDRMNELKGMVDECA
jgi:hypothetical protein